MRIIIYLHHCCIRFNKLICSAEWPKFKWQFFFQFSIIYTQNVKYKKKLYVLICKRIRNKWLSSIGSSFFGARITPSIKCFRWAHISNNTHPPISNAWYIVMVYIVTKMCVHNGWFFFKKSYIQYMLIESSYLDKCTLHISFGLSLNIIRKMICTPRAFINILIINNVWCDIFLNKLT